jgi:uronate dehydrogenase
MSAPPTLLLTGAAGGMGTLMRGLLPSYGYALRLLDARPVEPLPGQDGPEGPVFTAELSDRDALREALHGADAVLHLAGISQEASFERVLTANIEGAYHLYEAVRAEGERTGGPAPRVVFASSNHAAGFTPRPTGPYPLPPEALIPVDTPHRPDTYYGLSKCFGEDLAQLYADRYGVDTVSVRIGSCFPEPSDVRMLSLWLSPGDGARLFHAALTAGTSGHTVVYGSSANTRLWWDLGPARALGYVPQDDSEVFAPALLAAHGEPDPADPAQANLGGRFCTEPPMWPY